MYSTAHMKGKLSVELSWEVFRGCAKAAIIRLFSHQ